MQRILNSENIQFEKQELKRKKKSYGDNIETERNYYDTPPGTSQMLYIQAQIKLSQK